MMPNHMAFDDAKSHGVRWCQIIGLIMDFVLNERFYDTFK